MSNRTIISLVSISFVLLIISIPLRTFSFEFYSSILFSVIIFGGIIIYLSGEPQLHSVKNNTNFFPFFLTISGALYAVIAGLSLTFAIEFGFNAILKDLGNLTNDSISETTFELIIKSISMNQYEILVVVSFLLTAIPFYHGAMVFLSDQSKTLRTERSRILAIHFFGLFTQSIIMLGLAITLESFLFIIILFTLQMFADSVWISIIFSQKNVKIKPPKGWLGLNLAFVAAIWLIISPGWSLPNSAWLLVLICSIRTIVDYSRYQKIYFISFKEE